MDYKKYKRSEKAVVSWRKTGYRLVMKRRVIHCKVKVPIYPQFHPQYEKGDLNRLIHRLLFEKAKKRLFTTI